MSWTEERVEKLTKMWTEGNSASDIAKELGDVTRNAVIGKVHRLGLQGRTTKEAKATVETAKKAPKAKVVKETAKAKVEPEPVVEEDVEEDTITPPAVPATNDEISAEARLKAERVENESKKLTLMQLTERTCKWPVGDPATEDFWFCGHPSQAGKPYCEAHVELAFQTPMARRDRR